MRPSRLLSVRTLVVAVAVVGLVSLFLVLRSTTGRTATSPLTDRLDALFSRLVPDDDLPGCAAALYQEDRITWTDARGLADVAHGHPITDDTMFGAGHTTELFTETAALLLVERGALSRQDPISKFLPSLPAWARTVRVDDLMRHASGITNLHDLPLPRSGRMTGDALVAQLAGTELAWDPGTLSNPSDTDDVLLGLVVQKVTGRTLADFLATDVFPAAGIHAVLTRTPTGQNVASSYEAPKDTTPYSDELWPTVGNAGLYITARDLATWGAQYWDPTVGGAQLLKARMEITRTGEDPARPGEDSSIIPGTPPPGDLNWMMGAAAWTDEHGMLMVHARGRDSNSYGNGYGDADFASDLVVIPSEHVAAAVLCNHDSPDPDLPSTIGLRILDTVHGKRLMRPTVFW